MNEVKLPGTVFTAGEPPTLLPNEQQAPQNSNESWRLKSKYHNEIKKLMESRAQSARIFGSSWKYHLGFFVPFGTTNSFWERLKMSPTFRHLFAYDETLVKELSQEPGEKSLTTETSGARITVQDVDSAVNNCALICALLLGVPASIIGDMVGNQDGWIDYLNAMKQPDGKLCEPDNQTSSIYSDFCLREFEKHYQGFFVVTTVCFFSALFTLITAVCYYMCRPSESCNNTSMNVLFEACTLEVRARIREKRKLEWVDPETPFASWGEELEVFSKAKFMAQNEAEEQKNQEFYMWYKRGRIFVLGIFFGLLCTIFCASFSINVFVTRWFTVTSDTTKVPGSLRDHLFRAAWDFNTVSNTVGFLSCAIALYICV